MRFQNDKGVILDEIQKVPRLLSYIQLEVDQNHSLGRFVITGSQNILLNQHVSQSLAGRVAILTLLPLSIKELRDASVLPHTYPEALFKGCYPRVYNNALDPVVFSESYIRTYVERDVRDIQNVTSLLDFQKFMRLLAARIGQLLDLSDLAKDSGLSINTVKSWISILEASYVIFLLQPHFVNFNKRLVKMPKIYFYDTALACHLLRITNPDSVYDHYLRGGLFESFIISNFLKDRYNQGLPPNVYFWRDKTGHEVDCVLEEGGKLFPIEIKSSSTISSDFFNGLLKWCLIADVNPETCQVIYGGNETQKRQQGTIISWKSL
jgi:hypothetical protein